MKKRKMLRKNEDMESEGDKTTSEWDVLNGIKSFHGGFSVFL